MFIDTHCHFSKEYYDDFEEIINSSIEAGVNKIIVSGCELDNIQEVIDLACSNSNIYLTLGFHPSEVDLISDDDISKLRENIIKYKPIAIGEIGLDYHYGDINKVKQQEIFKRQLKLAIEFNLPVVIHSRDATLDTINILKQFSCTGVIHCFSGSIETALEYKKLGYKIGIGGILTFKNSKLFKIVDILSLDDIVLETDAPFLAPEPYRGNTNSSKYIPVIAKKIAEIKNTSLGEVSKVTTNTACELFDI